MQNTRIPSADLSGNTERQQAASHIQGSRGNISQLYQLLLHNPHIATGWEKLLDAIRHRSGLAPALRELVILRIALLNDAPYEFRSHVPIALEAGLSREQIAGLENDHLQLFGENEKLVLEYCDVMTREVQVSDALFARINALLDATTVMELTVTIAAYNMVSRFLEALHVR